MRIIIYKINISVLYDFAKLKNLTTQVVTLVGIFNYTIYTFMLHIMYSTYMSFL